LLRGYRLDSALEGAPRLEAYMWWLLVLILLVLVAAVAAVVVARRRATVGVDAREDRFVNPGRDRPSSGMDKYSEHGGTNG
jgi:hypothetical protein